MTWPTPPFLYAPSPLVAGASAAGAVFMAFLAFSEFRGANLTYSKFSRGGTTTGVQKKQQQQQRGGGTGGGGGGAVQVSSRTGMLLLYSPALVAALASFVVPGAVDGARASLLSGAIAVHFLKRVLEVLFVHRYSGSMPLSTSLLIAGCYLGNGGAMIYAQHLSHDLPEPAVDLLFPGVIAFAVGLAGNFYHHRLLARLRSGGDAAAGGEKKVYKIPTGGLFGLVTCPHYLFEIVAFFGFAMISQTLYALTVAVGTAAYLAGRSYATRRWYDSKFDEFPARIKALVPYVW